MLLISSLLFTAVLTPGYIAVPDSVLHKVNPEEKLNLNTVGWSVKMLLSCSQRVEGLMVERPILYQACKQLRQLNRVQIWGQCCLYVSTIFSSAAGIRLVGISGGAAEACGGGSGAACGAEFIAGSAVLGRLAGGASAVFPVVCLGLTVVDLCAVQI